MPASTRSASNQKAKLEPSGEDKVKSKRVSTTATRGSKRTADETSTNGGKQNAKRSKQAVDDHDDDGEDDSDVVTINRAPVLELWASCVTQAIHPSLEWQTCLSVGGAISTITAISKGRSIGKMDKPDPSEAQAKQRKRREQAEKEELEEVEVMSFHLRLKDGQAMVGDKPRKAGEEALRKKYGGSEKYERVREAFGVTLKAWKGKEDELNKKAFHMYEDFRPSVKPGQAGWGRKGQLRLATVREVVSGNG